MQVVNRIIGWFEDHGLWGLIITIIVMSTVCVTYTLEKRYEKTAQGNEFGYYSTLEFPFIDYRHRFFYDPARADDDIVIVTITETALDRYKSVYGRWPWPRSLMADVVNFLGHADSVMLDIGFINPSGKEVRPRKAKRWLQQIKRAFKLAQKKPMRSLPYLKSVHDDLNSLAVSGDRSLGKALKQQGRSFTATWFVDVASGHPPESELNRIDRALSRHGYRIPDDWGLIPKSSFVAVPIEPVLDQSYGLAHISFTPDPDGPARRFYPFYGIKSFPEAGFTPDRPFLPILGIAGALEEMGLEPGRSSVTVEQGNLKVGNLEIPLDEKGRALIRYKGGLKPRNSRFNSYREVPIERIIAQLRNETGRQQISPEFFKGKKVLVGSTATGAHDLRATPFSAQEAGVAIHANILDMMLNNDFLHPIRTIDTIMTVLLWTSAVGVIATLLSPMIALVLTVLVTTLLVVMGFGLFSQGYLINLSAPLLSSYTTYGLVTIYNLVFEQRKRRQIRNAFESYLTASVMEEVLEDPDELELGGERREITLLFADIAGFTNFSEGRTATEVASVISDIMTELTECVFRYEGVLDKYIGDELVAEFGIVSAEPGNHPRRACMAAVDMRERIHKLQEQWREEGGEVLELRIGIHTGYAATGNMGSEQLFDFTAIGDNVNLGSRLEGANKKYGTRSMISEDTYDNVQDDVEVRELDKITVKGKDQPVRVYELLGRKGEVGQDQMELKERFEEALEKYRQQEWEDAIEQFEALRQDFPDDPVADVFLERCQQYQDEPPPEDWDGVHRMKTK
ncbi:MAG: CHASE2 domain-containing protein [bacterium]